MKQENRPHAWWIMLAAAAALAILFRTKHRDWVYPLVFVWAFIGIGVRNMDDYPTVAYAAYSLALLIAAGTWVKGRTPYPSS